MPNFWTKTVQKIEESIDGPRTDDKEFIKEIEKMKNIKKALINLKLIVTNFTSYFEKIMSYNREISECIFVLFNNNDEFKEFADILTAVHVDNNIFFTNIVNQISSILKETNGWTTYYSNIDSLIEEREVARKIYDHYEKKLEKLEDKKEIKIQEGSFLHGSDFYNEVTRNEEKYLSAKREYIKKATVAYDTIDKLNKKRFDILTPFLLNIFFVEMKLYENFSNKYANYKDIEQKLYRMNEDFFRKQTKSMYNPMIYTKSPNLEYKFNKKTTLENKNNSVDPIKKRKDNEDEEKIKSPKTKKLTINDQNNEMNMNRIRSGSQYIKKPTIIIKQIFNDINYDDFDKIDNLFSNDVPEYSQHIKCGTMHSKTISNKISNEEIPKDKSKENIKFPTDREYNENINQSPSKNKNSKEKFLYLDYIIEPNIPNNNKQYAKNINNNFFDQINNSNKSKDNIKKYVNSKDSKDNHTATSTQNMVKNEISKNIVQNNKTELNDANKGMKFVNSKEGNKISTLANKIDPYEGLEYFRNNYYENLKK